MFLKSNLCMKGSCTRKQVVVRSSSSNFQAKVSGFFDRKKELDRARWEKLKEISRTIDHIAKNDIKQTYDLLKEINPVQQTEGKKESELKSVDLAEEETV
jgi:hypothetical protein